MVFSFSGEFEVRRAPAEVYGLLSDPDRFAPLLPDFESLERQDASHFTVKLKVGVSHIRGTASVRMALAEAEPSRRARYEGAGDVPGGSVAMSAGFELAPVGAGTKVSWKGDAKLVGKLISLAGGMLEPLARKNVQRLIDSLQAALA